MTGIGNLVGHIDKKCPPNHLCENNSTYFCTCKTNQQSLPHLMHLKLGFKMPGLLHHSKMYQHIINLNKNSILISLAEH